KSPAKTSPGRRAPDRPARATHRVRARRVPEPNRRTRNRPPNPAERPREVLPSQTSCLARRFADKKQKKRPAGAGLLRSWCQYQPPTVVSVMGWVVSVPRSPPGRVVAPRSPPTSVPGSSSVSQATVNKAVITVSIAIDFRMTIVILLRIDDGGCVRLQSDIQTRPWRRTPPSSSLLCGRDEVTRWHGAPRPAPRFPLPRRPPCIPLHPRF